MLGYTHISELEKEDDGDLSSEERVGKHEESITVKPDGCDQTVVNRGKAVTWAEIVKGK